MEMMTKLYLFQKVGTGFLTKQKNTSLVYFHSNNHNKNYEKIINYKDKRLKIKLPLKVRSISGKDRLAYYNR